MHPSNIREIGLAGPAVRGSGHGVGAGRDSAKGAFRVKKLVAMLLGLLLASLVPAASMAGGKASTEAAMARNVRRILSETRDPQRVAMLLERAGARFLGFQEASVTFVYTGDRVIPVRTGVRTVGPDLRQQVSQSGLSGDAGLMAGEKVDLTLMLWLYEWQNRDGSFTEQAAVSGYWSDTEYSWIDDPQDVIDVRWIVGDLVYLSSQPFDGVQRDQHMQGVASFTVDDQVEAWDLFVNFRPVSSDVYGKWTNVFANYTHTWLGVKLEVTLGAGPTGSTGTVRVHTDGKSWTEGTGLAIRIGSGQSRGPGVTGFRVPTR